MRWMAGAGHCPAWVVGDLPGGFLRDLVTEGVIAGVGSVVVFLPQIVILFAFILVMEATGYMARAAFMMDRMMASVGLSGRSFIPLLSSFACAIPGIMATRSIADPKDRLTTILIAPLMTCSARLPVYAVIIAAFIPRRQLSVPGIGLAGAGAVRALCCGHRRARWWWRWSCAARLPRARRAASSWNCRAISCRA